MESTIPWIEKYRPATIDEIIFDINIRKQINIFLEDKKNVHLIFTGPPGIGKTSTARCIAKTMLGEYMEAGYLEINAAEDRGVRSMSTRIPPFCKKVVDFTTSKIILLDEADIMTSKCQYDINNMIKEFGKKTKFIFTCNDSTKIIEDLQSVCRILRFKKLTDQQISSYLSKICEKENIEYDKPGLDTICYISYGDMRKSINDLQKTACTYNKVTKNTVLKICRVPDPEEIKKIIALCLKGNLMEADKEMNDIIKLDFCYFDIVSSFVYVLSSYDMDECFKLQLIDIVNKTKTNVSKGLHSRLQLSGMICRIIKQIKQNNLCD
ncbi:clamp loader of DNA polymerase [Acanthamoeba polyphaga moumouvirus]|uniref:Putative replication factor C small subunit n=2 Tax=Moumouvirus TaxID=3080801 RepID=L7RG33_9VIRU|nr:clamp loader of DNA polymerase [Acanthamoeba polyphaga moumouvirus]AGC01960.1 putative replication factor C small subunit [Acanthamoeba polyphaga moumouvirus]AQN68322.1 putative replication factor c small subunit [Saudi moumouvirus]